MFEFAAIVAAIGILLTGMAISNIYMMYKQMLEIILPIMQTINKDIQKMSKQVQKETDRNPWER